jgi:hypothetical protein
MTTKPRKPLLVNLTWATVALLVLAIVYVLTSGPVIAIWYRMEEPERESHIKTIEVVYAPLTFLNDRSERVRAVFVWYLRLWNVDAQ